MVGLETEIPTCQVHEPFYFPATQPQASSASVKQAFCAGESKLPMEKMVIVVPNCQDQRKTITLFSLIITLKLIGPIVTEHASYIA
jgi:hypothetical protein